MNISEKLRDIRFALEDIDDVTINPELKAKIAEILPLVREAYEIRKRELGRTDIQSSRKPIKSFRDTSNEDTSNDYGFYWEGENIYDKDGNHWYYGDYINGNTGIEPYSSYIQAVKETVDDIRNSFTEDEISDPEDYAYQLVDFAVETMEDPGKYIKEYEGF